MKLGLGTVQFGLNYGISNSLGQTTSSEISSILKVAQKNGIRFLDTAAGYGDSERLLGENLSTKSNFEIITKVPSVNSAQELNAAFLGSLARLNQAQVYGLLFHRVEDLLSPVGGELMKAMQELKENGKVRKIGVSVYTGDEIDRVLENFSVDLIQVPINVLDQRLLQSGHLKRLKEQGVEVHARSVFLQGLLLMDPSDLAPRFESIRKHLVGFNGFLKARNLSRLSALAGFVAAIPEIDVVLCGVNTSDQLNEICDQFNGSSAHLTSDLDGIQNFSISDPQILNPSNWKNPS